ncbi:carbohydrate kinase family protein [Wukongibacter baidiensis]|uniref:carbohydrate kinase family protein n=1 Tax=Wukongibacter baidiensis TaxID=1723361 RepID=UPI003D7FEDC9
MNRDVLILGGLIIDNYYMTKEYPSIGQDTEINNFFERVGGCSINVGITLRNLGCVPYIVSGVGNDERGKRVEKYLTDQELDKEFISKEDGNTGFCLVLLDESGERTFLTYKGCEEKISEDILQNPEINNMAYVYITGYYMLSTEYKEVKLSLLRTLRNNGSKLIFDPGSMVDQIEDDFLRQILELSHIIMPNKSELRKLETKLKIDNGFTKWCLNNNFELVVEKDGSKELKAYTKDNQFSVSPYKVKSVDTTGAGDSFAAGLIYGLVNGMDIETTLKIASACGALATTFLEPHGNFGIDEVKEIVDI